jgi:hypothetical protein
MNKPQRNDPCPCGSGKKFKKCCAVTVEAVSNHIGHVATTPKASPSMRVKGGVRYDDNSQGYIAIVHVWDNAACLGSPKEMKHPQVFNTEEAAMHFYKTTIRPTLHKLNSDTDPDHSGLIEVLHTKLEE